MFARGPHNHPSPCRLGTKPLLLLARTAGQPCRRGRQQIIGMVPLILQGLSLEGGRRRSHPSSGGSSVHPPLSKDELHAFARPSELLYLFVTASVFVSKHQSRPNHCALLKTPDAAPCASLAVFALGVHACRHTKGSVQ